MKRAWEQFCAMMAPAPPPAPVMPYSFRDGRSMPKLLSATSTGTVP